jgi:hypothetical protein
MGARDPAEAVEVMDLLLKFFGDGERWVKGRLSDRRGNRCLVGALDFVSSHHGMKGDGAERYLADEISAREIAIMLAGTVPDSEPAFAELCPGAGIGSARVSFAGTLSLDCGTADARMRGAVINGNQRVPASPGVRSGAPTVIGAHCTQNFVARQRQDADHRPITPSIWECRLT